MEMVMAQHGGPQRSEELDAWIKQQIDAAVQELIARGVVDSAVVEAKPAWVLPFALLIGKVREHGRASGFDWFICGDAPITITGFAVADRPREAARHFALQWQLEAARQGEAGKDLAKKAEALYELVEEDGLWRGAEQNA
jgi:hypothetical protein